RTDGRSDGSSSWKLERISNPEASQIETAATTAAAPSVRKGRAMLNEVRRATTRLPGRCTAREYHIGPTAGALAVRSRLRGSESACFSAPVDAGPEDSPRRRRGRAGAAAPARSHLGLRSRRGPAPARRLPGGPGQGAVPRLPRATAPGDL